MGIIHMCAPGPTKQITPWWVSGACTELLYCGVCINLVNIALFFKLHIWEVENSTSGLVSLMWSNRFSCTSWIILCFSCINCPPCQFAQLVFYLIIFPFYWNIDSFLIQISFLLLIYKLILHSKHKSICVFQNIFFRIISFILLLEACLFYYFVYMSIFLHLCMWNVWDRFWRKAEEFIRSSRTGVKDICEASCGCWEVNRGPWKNQYS